MTKFVFFEKSGGLLGFSLSGHCTSNENDEDGRLLCSAVSSAAYLTANTVTEILGCKPHVSNGENEMTVLLSEFDSTAGLVFSGLKLHIKALSLQYPDNLNLTIQEV